MTQESKNAQKNGEKDRFSVFSLNIRFGLAEDGPNGWEFRKSGFPDLLGKYEADFMAFQEVNDFQGEFVRGILVDHDFIGKRESAPEYWQNNIVFYKKTWKCVGWNHFFLSDTPEQYSRFPESKWPRQCTMGLFEKGRTRLIFVNTHFDFDREVQVKSAAAVMKLLTRFPQDVPAIIVGDFNCPPSEPCRAVFTGEKPEFAPEGASFFQPVFQDLGHGTFHGFTGKPGDDQIDWILYRGNIEPVKREVVLDKFADIYPSDHFPLFAAFVA